MPPDHGETIMKTPLSPSVAVASVLAAGTLLYGMRAAAFFDVGGDVILADILANAVKQLSVATESLAELRRSYGEVKRVAEYADDAATAARSFQHFSTSRFGDRFLTDLDAAYPDLERFRRDALGDLGLSGSEWARGTGTLQRLSRYCLGGAAAGRPACLQLRGELEGSKVLAALAATFGRPGAAVATETKAVDAEVAAVIQANAAQERLASLQKARLRELLRQCNEASGIAGNRDAKRRAEECRLAAEQAQLLHLEEGQETNVKLAQIARLQALAVEQKNADLKRELAEQAARRAALTHGLEELAQQRVTIRSGGLAP
jgi:hypothetical protein